MDPNASKQSGIPKKASGLPTSTSIPSRLPTASTIPKRLNTASGSGVVSGESHQPVEQHAPTAATAASHTTASSSAAHLPSVRTSATSLHHATTTASSKTTDTTAHTGARVLPKSSSDASVAAQLASSSASALTSAPRVASAASAAAAAATATTTATSAAAASPVDNSELASLRSTVKDLNEKLETLKLKRAEDREKLREFDKFKLQQQQLVEFKKNAQDVISNLNKEVQQAKQEAKAARDQYDTYKEEMSNHEQRIEECTVDKELAEEKVEELQDELAKMSERLEEVKLELDVLKSEIELNGAEGVSASYHSKQQEKEQECLKVALIKMRDLSLQDKSEIGTLRKQNDELAAKIKALSKECDTLKADNGAFLAQINDLKDQVTATLGSVQMIEQLTEQNLDLEAKLIELRENIADMEAINEVNDQLQENAREEEKELRQSLDLAENRIRESEKQIELLKYTIADHEKTILKFRDLVKQLQLENDNLKRTVKQQLEEKGNLLNAAAQQSSTSTFDFKQRFIETKNLAMIITNDVNKIELQSQKKYNSYLLSYLSDIFLKRSGDNECILTLLFFKRVVDKCDLILNHVKDKISALVSNKETSRAALAGQLSFLNDISMTLVNIKLVANKYEYVLNTCEPKLYANIGLMYYDLQAHEKNLDFLIDLLAKDQLDETINLEMIDKLLNHFQTVFKNYLANEKREEVSFLIDLIHFSSFGCECITTCLQRLAALHEVKDDSSEIFILFKELSCKSDEIGGVLKKLFKNLPKEEKTQNRIILCLPLELLAELDGCVSNFSLLTRTLKELYNLASNSKLFFINDPSEMLTAKKLESLAYQACDKVYLSEDNGPYENLRTSINFLNDTFTKLNVSLENGELEKELSSEEFKINSPAATSAEHFKNTLAEAEAIKHKLETKEEEIKEIRKLLKMKTDELSEQKLRTSIAEKKGEEFHKEFEEKNAKLLKSIEELKAELAKKEKEHTETLEALQQEVDSLQNERRDLKDKLRQTTKKAVFDNIINRQMSDSTPESVAAKNSAMSGGSYAADSPLVLQIKQEKSLNALLLKNYHSAKQNIVQSMLDKLPPIPVLQQQPPRQTKEATAITSDKQITTSSKPKSLFVKSNNIINDVYSSMANVKVLNLKQLKKSELKHTTINATLTANDIQAKLKHLQNEFDSLLPPQSFTPSDINSKLIAEITLLVDRKTDAAQRGVDLNMNYKEIKDIIRNI